MARTSLELNATVTGVQSIQQLSSALNESKERMKEFANMSEYDKLTQEAANFRNLQNEIAKYNQTVAQSAQGGSYTANAFNAYRNSGYGGQNPLYANATTANASKSLEQRISDLNKTIDDLTDELDDIIEKKDYRGANNVSATINQLESEKKRLEIEKQRQDSEGKDSSKNLGRYFGVREFSQILGELGNIAQAGFTYRQDIANGNYLGAETRQATSVASSVSSMVTGAGAMIALVNPIIGGIIAGLGAVGNAAAKYFQGLKETEIAEGNAYMQPFAQKYGAFRMFNNPGASYLLNREDANSFYRRAYEASKGTGLDTDEMLAQMQNAAIYGLGEKASLNLVANSAKWVQETGADMNALMKLQGTASRYGLGDNVIQNAYGGLIASGMGRGQFNEFLQGLQTVIEDGISNGYITSTEDVTRNLTMYARLSDNNPLWQGQNGARMFTQMNNNLAQATSLSDTNSALVFSALHKGGSYVDTMEAIEKGLNDKDAFGKIFSTFMQSEGGNYEGVIERLRATYGLNYTQAKQVFAMGNKLGSAGYTQADFERDIKANGITPNAETEQTIWKDVENDLKNSMQLIGMGRWEQNLEELKNLAAEERGRGLETAASETEKNERANGVVIETGNENKGVDRALGYTAADTEMLRRYAPNQASATLRNLLEESYYTTHGINIPGMIPKERNIPGAQQHGGNDEYDNYFKEQLGLYAASTGDGKLSQAEIAKVLELHDAKNVQDVYNKGDFSAYKDVLRSVLTEVFGNLTVTENSN